MPLAKINTRSAVIVVLVVGSLWLALTNESFLEIFGDIAKVGIGGYLGQLNPEKDRLE